MDEARRVKLLLHIPMTVTPGRYMLVLSGTTSSGYMDLARARIAVLPRPQRDVRRLLMRLAGNPTDLAAMEELAGAAGDLAGELGLADAVALTDDITGEIVHKDKKKKEIRVKNRIGREQKVKVTRRTVILDANGDPITFDDLHEGDRVDVEYNSRNEATRIEVL